MTSQTPGISDAVKSPGGSKCSLELNDAGAGSGGGERAGDIDAGFSSITSFTDKSGTFEGEACLDESTGDGRKLKPARIDRDMGLKDVGVYNGAGDLCRLGPASELARL